MTLRLSSACSNQLSYRPLFWYRVLTPLSLTTKSGGKEIRTPDLLLAKQPLYQLSYAPLCSAVFLRVYTGQVSGLLLSLAVLPVGVKMMQRVTDQESWPALLTSVSILAIGV